MFESTTTTRSSLIKSVPKQSPSNILLAALLLLHAICSSQALELNTSAQQQHAAEAADATRSRSPTLEAELESIVQQRDSFDPTDRSLADLIISRLMEDNLVQNEQSPSAEFVSAGGEEFARADQLDGEHQAARTVSGPEALRLKKLLSMFEAYENLLNSADGRSIGSSMGLTLPILPASQAATTKRATKLAGSYLAQQQQQQHHQATRSNPTTGYGRSSFDFGLGKRPDTTGGASSNILRFGDSLGGGGGGSVQGVNQFGKRPSAHRYDFGLGKRKASSAYPRYDFGLGKRAPNGIRYDFGLGKK